MSRRDSEQSPEPEIMDYEESPSGNNDTAAATEQLNSSASRPSRLADGETSSSTAEPSTSSTLGVYNSFFEMEDGCLVEWVVDNSGMDAISRKHAILLAIDKMADDIAEYFHIPATIKLRAYALAFSHEDPKEALLERLRELKGRVVTLLGEIKRFDDLEYGTEDRNEVWSPKAMSIEDRERRVTRYEKANLIAVRCFLDEKIGDIELDQLSMNIDDPLAGIWETVRKCEEYRERNSEQEDGFSIKKEISLVHVAERKEGTKPMFEEAIEQFPRTKEDLVTRIASRELYRKLKSALAMLGIDIGPFIADFLKLGSPEGFLAKGPFYNRLLFNLASHFAYDRAERKWRMVKTEEGILFNKIPFDVHGNASNLQKLRADRLPMTAAEIRKNLGYPPKPSPN